MAEDEESSEPLKFAYRQQLHSVLKQGYLDDVDPSVLYAEDKSSRLPGFLGKAADKLESLRKIGR